MTRTTISVFLLAALRGVCGCGRSDLDGFYDGAPPGRRDGGRDAGRDGDVPPLDAGCRSARDCDDGLLCNGAESCVGGACVPGRPLLCDDGVGCTEDRCLEASGGCESLPDPARCAEGEVCDPAAGCVRVPCESGRDCDDGYVCNGTERCGRDGFCRGGTRPDCEDGVECTVDECSEGAAGCVSRPDDRRCDDGRFCNGRELCLPFGCGPGPVPSCDDGDVCTTDRCDRSRDACVHEPIPDPDCMTASCPNGDLGRRVGAPVAAGTTSRRSNAQRGSCGGDSAPDMSFAWQAPSDGVFRFDTWGSAYDTLLYLLGGCGAPELPMACNDDTAMGTTSEVVVPLRAGQRILIVVDGFGSSAGDFVLNIGLAGGTEAGRCTDRVDNDGDGLVDCEDPDCFPDLACGGCVPIAPVEFDCRNGLDDDCNGALDCADLRCAADPACGGCMPVSRRELVCDDRRDDDCDGRVDCMDPDCAGRPPCGACTPTGPRELVCIDRRDDDCDGLIDCMDPDCARTPACSGCVPVAPIEVACNDGRDDDCDRRIDCSDGDCLGNPVCDPDAGVPDGGICVAREIGVAACTNRLDEDCDGRRDCADTDCSPFGPEGECCDGRDDDGDGQIDIFTCRCLSDADCRGVGTLEQVCWTSLFSVCAPRCNFYGGDAFCRMVDPGLRCNPMSGQCFFPRGP